jgi:hypothetical protein
MTGLRAEGSAPGTSATEEEVVLDGTTTSIAELFYRPSVLA